MVNLRYWWNNGFQKRFQKYTPNYTDVETQTELINVFNIGDEVSISMFVPEADTLCPFEPLRDVKMDYIQFYPNEDHGFFSYHNEPEFIEELVNQFISAIKDKDQEISKKTYISSEL